VARQEALLPKEPCLVEPAQWATSCQRILYIVSNKKEVHARYAFTPHDIADFCCANFVQTSARVAAKDVALKIERA